MCIASLKWQEMEGYINVFKHSMHYMLDKLVLGPDVEPRDSWICTVYQEIFMFSHESGINVFLNMFKRPNFLSILL